MIWDAIVVIMASYLVQMRYRQPNSVAVIMEAYVMIQISTNKRRGISPHFYIEQVWIDQEGIVIDYLPGP